MKIMTICFETELKTEWPKILRTMRLLNKRNEASMYLWNFIEFVVTHRTALYIQMLPFIVHKIGQAPISEHERNMQTTIRAKINGDTKSVPKSRGSLLTDLIHELRKLKEEIEDRKFGWYINNYKNIINYILIFILFYLKSEYVMINEKFEGYFFLSKF